MAQRGGSNGDQHDRFRVFFDRVRDIILLGVGVAIIGHEVIVRVPGPNLLAVGVGLVFTLGPAAFALLPPYLGGPPKDR